MSNVDTKEKEQWTKATLGNLPPFLVLETDEKCEGIIIAVDETDQERKVKVKGKWTTETIERINYRMELTELCHAHTGKKDEKTGKYPEVTFEKGQVVTLPNSGQLDTVFRGIALERAGESKDSENEPDFQKLVGLKCRIKRLPDQTMKKGPYKGKSVKSYDVEYVKNS